MPFNAGRRFPVVILVQSGLLLVEPEGGFLGRSNQKEIFSLIRLQAVGQNPILFLQAGP